ncbi:MAG: AI-2E family transporter [Lachnospiraceae bacterium]|nr:AI-2E family transporter [Lachnospiraceae bacterium]
MKLKINSKYLKWGVTAFAVIAAGVFLVYLIFNVSEFMKNFQEILSVLMPIAVGFIIAYLLSPIVNFLEDKLFYPLCKKLKWKITVFLKKLIRAISIFVTIVLVFMIIYLLVAMLVSQIVPSLQAIVKNFDSYIQNVTAWINDLPVDNAEISGYFSVSFTNIMQEVDEWLSDTTNVLSQSGEILKTLSSSLIGFLSVTWDVIIGVIISIYVLASKEVFISQAKKIVYAIFEKNTANHIIDSMHFTHRTFIGFISGKILDSLIIGILCFIGTSLLGLPYAALISVIIGVTNVIPFFGPFLGAIPSAILILIVDLSHPLNCVYFLIFILALQQFDGNVLGPLILGDSTGLSGFWVIFSITAFGGLLGVPGMIIGVPVFAVLYAGVKGIVNSSLKKKELPTETEQYLKLKAIDDNGEFVMLPEEDARNQQTKKPSKLKKLLTERIQKRNTQKTDKK